MKRMTVDASNMGFPVGIPSIVFGLFGPGTDINQQDKTHPGEHEIDPEKQGTVCSNREQGPVKYQQT
jgi:hypothetical protein